MTKPQEAAPGDGIRSMKTTNVFRVVNFELYAKPVSSMTIMGVGGVKDFLFRVLSFSLFGFHSTFRILIIFFCLHYLSIISFLCRQLKPFKKFINFHVQFYVAECSYYGTWSCCYGRKFRLHCLYET